MNISTENSIDSVNTSSSKANMNSVQSSREQSMTSNLSINSYSQISTSSVTDTSSKNINMTSLSSSISQPIRISLVISSSQ